MAPRRPDPKPKPRDWNEKVKIDLPPETALKALLRTPPPDDTPNGKPASKKRSER
jgi:hypothetical protein